MSLRHITAHRMVKCQIVPKRACAQVCDMPLIAHMEKRLLTASEVAQHLGVPRRTFYNWLKRGRFPVQPVEGLTPQRWSIESVDLWRAGV